jgi:hypothetical protein
VRCLDARKDGHTRMLAIVQKDGHTRMLAIAQKDGRSLFCLPVAPVYTQALRMEAVCSSGT